MIENSDAFKVINENPITLDFTGFKFLGEVHRELKKKFGLPDYYGENWNALWDCLRYIFDRNIKVEIRGFNSLPEDLKKEVSKMFSVFETLHAKAPEFTYETIS